jgi:hypothetical protein
MIDFVVLPRHAAMALGIDIDQLNLPSCGLGVSGDALWVDPRFLEVRRQRQATARRLFERRYDAELHRPARVPEDVEAALNRARQRRIRAKSASGKAQFK